MNEHDLRHVVPSFAGTNKPSFSVQGRKWKKPETLKECFLGIA
jgi:hypothetical protein